MVNYGFLGLIGVLVLFGVLLGFARGICRQTVRLLTVAASAVIAFFVAGNLFPEFEAAISEMSIEELLAAAGASVDESVAELIGNFNIEVLTYVLALPVALVLVPMIFVSAFVAISAVAEIVHKIFSGIFGFTRRNNNMATRCFGAIVGGVQGVLVTLVLLVPISGLISTVGGAVDYVCENQSDEVYTETVAELYDYAFAELDENPVYQLASDIPTRVYDSFQKIEINGREIYTKDVVTTLVSLYVELGDLDGADLMDLTKEDKAAIDEILLTIDSDYYTCALVLQTLSHFVDTGDFSLELDTDNAKVDILLGDIIKLLATSSPETVPEDLETFKTIYYLLNDSGILSYDKDGEGNLFLVFLETDDEGKTVMSRLNTALASNPRTAVISKDLAEIAMMIVLANTGLDEVVAPERVESVKSTLNEVASINREDYDTEEEYKEEVKSKIDMTLQENEIALDEEQVETITEYVIENFEGKEEITDEDMAKFMSEYYDAYVKMLESGEEVPEIPEIPGILG